MLQFIETRMVRLLVSLLLHVISPSASGPKRRCGRVRSVFVFCVMASSEMVYRVSPDWSEMLYLYGRGFLANTESPNRTWLQEYVLPGRSDSK